MQGGKVLMRLASDCVPGGAAALQFLWSAAGWFALAALACSVAPAGAADREGVTWPEGQALPTFAAARHLDVADIEDIPGDEQLLFATLQGIVNRSQPRIYLLHPSDEGKETWLRDGLGVSCTMHDSPWKLLDKYGREARGLVVYDPQAPDTVNVATTLAGLKDALAVSPGLLDRLTSAPFNYAVLDDLRGRFASRLDAYQWQFENLWPQTTHRMLIALSPTRGVEIRDRKRVVYTELLRESRPVQNASNREVREVDLSPFVAKGAAFVRFEDSHPEDGWGAALHEVVIRADDKVIGRFVPGTEEELPFLYDAGGSATNPGSGGHRFADNGRFFTYRFAPPAGTRRLVLSLDIWNQFRVSALDEEPPRTHREEPYAFLRDYAVANRAMVFWLDPNITGERTLLERIFAGVKPYTPYLGWFAQDVAGEFGGTELASRHGVYVLAADWSPNLTVFSGARASLKRPKSPPAPKLENKVYVSFVMSEGDNLQYNQHRMRRLWDDPARGRVPITWTTTPVLQYVAPAVLAHFQRTATPNDLLIAGPSGAGYIYPTPWPDATFDVFARATDQQMRRTGMNTVYVLNRIDGRDIPLDPVKAKAYARVVKPKGLFLGWDGRLQPSAEQDGMPIAVVRGTGNAAEVRRVIQDAVAGWDGRSPKFVAIGVLAWSTTPSDLAAIAASVGPEVSIVRGDQFFDLMRAAGKAG